MPVEDDPQAPSNLLARSATALKWNYAGVLVRVACQLAIGVVLARMLGPAPFGVVAIAWLLIGACNLFADFGLAAALVQKEHVAERDIRFVFTCQVALGALLTGIGMLVADSVASYFGVPDAAAPLRAMFGLFLIQSIGQTSAALLRRSLDFRYLQQISIGSYLLGYLAIGIPGAVAGWGVWALVAANLTQASASTIGLLLRARAPLGWASHPSSDGLVRFGSKVVAANLSSWVLSNLDSLAVGRMLGVEALGLYNRAMTLVSSPMGAFVSGLQGVLFAACSRAQHQPHNLRRAYLGATTAVGLVCLPLFLSVAAVSDTVIVGLYGKDWVLAAAPLVPLAMAMPLVALLAVAGPVLMSMDRVSDELRAQAIVLVALLPLLYFASRHSIMATGWAMLVIYALRWALLTRAVLGALSLRLAGLSAALAVPAVLTLFVVAAVWVVDRGLLWHGVAATTRLLLEMVAGAVALLVSLRALGPRLLRGDLGDFLRARGPLPAPLARLLNVDA